MPLASMVDGKAYILGCLGGERVLDGVVATLSLPLHLLWKNHEVFLGLGKKFQVIWIRFNNFFPLFFFTRFSFSEVGVTLSLLPRLVLNS